MKDAQEFIQTKQTSWALRKGVTLTNRSTLTGVERNYTTTLDANLFMPLAEIARISFQAADGNELKGKMQALGSSSALAVNLFAYWNKIEKVSTMGELLGLPSPEELERIEFESIIVGSQRKPNLDAEFVYTASSKQKRVFVECKFVEPYRDETKAINQKYFESGAFDDRGGRPCYLAATHHHIKADPARLQQVFWNLIRNALKFTPATGRVLITTRNLLPNTFTLDVTDTGRGIIPEALPRIFDAFEQGDVETTRQFGGLGLGLAISKTLVEMHGGKLRAESRGAGTGASFILDLEVAHEEVERAEAQSPGTDGELDSQRILLVEDHVATSQLMLRLLRKRGHEVEAAHTKADAIQLGRQQSFDIVISDLGLPDGNGYEVMEALRETSRAVGIALSGYGMEADIQRSAQAGFAFHLTKPVDTHTLYSMIDRIAETRVIKA